VDEKAQKLLERIRANRSARAVQEAPAETFAKFRGWYVCAPFNVECLFARKGTTRNKTPLVAVAFDFFQGPTFPIAIVAHCTESDAFEAWQFAKRHSLDTEEFPSWRDPALRAVLLVRRSFAS
jgi:hypothetical protein